MTKYGAYHRRKHDDIVWFRTSQEIAEGFYSLESYPKEAADVYTAESVPALIMHVYPWVHEEESDFQEETASPDTMQTRWKTWRLWKSIKTT